MEYTGYKNLYLSDEELENFYRVDRELDLGLSENEYGIIYDSNNEIVDKVVRRNGEDCHFKWRAIENDFQGKIRPRNLEQELAFELFQNRDSKVKLLRGVYGSGKLVRYLIFAPCSSDAT